MTYRDYSKTASENTARYPEGMQREDLNNQLRAMEARHRTFAEELPWFEFSGSVAYATATSFTVPGDHTSLLTVGSTVRAVGTLTGDIQGEITVSAYSDPNTTVTVVWNSGSLSNETLTIYKDVGGANAEETIVSQTITADHQITAQDDNKLFLIDASSNDVDLTAPAKANMSNGFFFHFKRIDSTSNTVRVVPFSETLPTIDATIDDGVNWPVTAQYTSGTISYDGTNLNIVSQGRRPLSTGEVTESKLGDGAVTQVKIADNAVSLAKISHGTGNKVVGFAADGTPAEIDNGAGVSAARVSHIDTTDKTSGANSQAFATTSNEIWAIGTGASNANGSHTATTMSLPRRVAGFPTDKAVSKIVSGHRCHYVLTTDGKVYAWGANGSGQLGLGNTSVTATMEQITALDGVVVTDISVPSPDSGAVPCAFFLTSTGTVYSCGSNTYGVLGQGASPADSTTATLISGLTGVDKVRVSSDTYPHVVTVQTDGTVRSWGYNASGQLGNGNTTNQDTPQTPSSITGVSEAALSSGGDGATNSGFSILLKTDGSLQAAGENKSGQLGQGNTTDLSSFTNITFSPAATITKISAAGGSVGVVAALDDAGNMWSWGYNFYGQHGLGNTTNQTSPQKTSESWQTTIVDVKVFGEDFYTGIFVRTASQAWAAGYGAQYNLVIGAAVAENNTFSEVLGIDGNIDDFGTFGSSFDWGIRFLMTDGRLLVGGESADSVMGLGNSVDQGTLQPVKGFTQKAERAIPNDRGTWATSTRYELGDKADIAGPPKKYFLCIKSHDSSSGDEPGTGVSWATYWVLMGEESMHVGNDTVTNITTNFAAASYTGYMAFVTNETGGAVPAFSDGTNWRRVTDRAIIS